jgi:dihydrolipoamide dehydrogenase
MANEYDVVVIGAGPGGYVAAIKAAQLGQKVALVEKEYMGGVCLNIGCIPSKALLKNAEVAHLLQHRNREFGFKFDNLQLDYAAAFKRSRQVSDRLTKGVGFLMKKNNVEVYEGTGKLTDAHTVQVALKSGDETSIKAKNIIIATGARPAQIPGLEVDGQRVISYIEAILSDKLPQKAVIVGAGPIGMEFAYVWANYGVEVTIVELLDHLLPREDPEVSEVVEKAYKRLGIKFYTGTAVEKLDRDGDSAGDIVKVNLKNGDVIEADQVMVAVGFRSNVENIGLEEAGVELSERNTIAVDEQMRTNIPHIYAVGDVVAPEGYMFAHHGSAMGIVAAEVIAGHPTVALNYRMLPRCTYCIPQVASFGYTEAEAKDAGYEIKVGRFPFQVNGKALGMGEREGFVKIISDARYGEILGAHMVGPEVTELLPELTLAQMAELTAEEVARNVHAHPTLSEVLMEAAHGVEGEPIHI